MWDGRTSSQSMVFLRWEIHNAFEAGGAQCPWGCIDDRWKSALGFWGGEGGSGDAVSEHLEEHMEDGGREGRVSEKRGEEAADEGVAGQGGRQGKGSKF